MSFLCCQKLKKCIYSLLRMVVIFELPRAEDMYLLLAQDGSHFYATKSWRNFVYTLRMVVIFKLSREFLDKYLRLNSSPWWISLVYKRILFALHKSYYVDVTIPNMEGFISSRFIFYPVYVRIVFFLYSNQIQFSLWAG